MSDASLERSRVLGRLRDPVRVGLQGAAAVAASYGVMTWTGWDHLSWALISALFVLQLNSDATRRSNLRPDLVETLQRPEGEAGAVLRFTLRELEDDLGALEREIAEIQVQKKGRRP